MVCGEQLQEELLEATPQWQAKPTTDEFWQSALAVPEFRPRLFEGGTPSYHDDMPSFMSSFACVVCMSGGQEGDWTLGRFVCSSCTSGAASSNPPTGVPHWL